MSFVRPPSRRASVPSYAAMTCAPETSSARGRLPAAEREPLRVLLGAAGRLPDEVGGARQLDVDEARAVLPVRWSSRSGGRPADAGGRSAATAPRFVVVDRLGAWGHHPVRRLQAPSRRAPED